MIRAPSSEPVWREGRQTAGAVIQTALLLLILAAALRFWRLGYWSFWADEVFTLRDLWDWDTIGTYPVGYFLIALAVKCFGTGEFAARLTPALVGSVSVPLVYLMGRAFFSNRAALLAALLLALTGFHIFYSQYARYYTLVMLLGMLGMWAAFYGIERNRRRWLAAAVLLLALACWTHWAAGLLLPALFVSVAWLVRANRPPEGLRIRNAAILFGPFALVGLVASPALLRFFSQWIRGGTFSLAQLALLGAKTVDRFEPAVLICAALGTWALFHDGKRTGKWLLPYAAVPPLLVMLLVGFSHGGSRFVLVSLPAVVLLAGDGLDRVLSIAGRRDRKLAWAVVGLVVLSLALKDVRYFTVEHGQRPRWREAISFVASANPHAKVIATTPEIFEHYAGRKAHALCDFSGAALADELGRPSEAGVWVLVEHTANVAPTQGQWAALHRHAVMAAKYPLRVRSLLDYSISVFRVQPGREEARTVR